MSRVRHEHTEPELAVRRFLHAAGFRFRVSVRSLPGIPDIVLPKREAVVFVHGCFWHSHRNCRRATTPSTNRAFWRAKFAGNVARDKRNAQRLRRLGWRVYTIWECQVRDTRALASLARRLTRGNY